MQWYERIATVIAVLSSACGAPESANTGAAVEIVDSLGVSVVTNHAAENPSGSWRLGNLVTSIGVVEGDSMQILGNPVAARRLESGHYAVADQMTNEIRVYDTDGEHVVTRGRAGEGPGEYQWLGFLFPYRGDSIAAVEIFGGRISVLGPDLAFGRAFFQQPTFLFRREGFQPEQSCCMVVGTMDGTFVVEYPGMIPVTGFGKRRSTVTIVRLAADGTFQDTLGTFDSVEYHPAGAGSRSPVQRSLLSNGVVSVAVDSTLYVTEGRTYEVKAIGRNGNVRQIFRIARAAEPITADVKARYRASMEARLDEQRERNPEMAAANQSVRRWLEETPYHATLPTINTMLIDRAGNLWVAALHSYWRGTSSESWEVFDPTGRWLATVDIPSDLRVFEIGDDYLIALFRDELEVPFVRVYELLKS